MWEPYDLPSHPGLNTPAGMGEASGTGLAMALVFQNQFSCIYRSISFAILKGNLEPEGRFLAPQTQCVSIVTKDTCTPQPTIHQEVYTSCVTTSTSFPRFADPLTYPHIRQVGDGLSCD
jgi:hypothetical protein